MKETKKSTKKPIKREENRWIDVHNDAVMREMGFLRPYLQAPRDKSVWTKTKAEKMALAKVKHKCKGDMHFHSIPSQSAKFTARLIVNLRKNKHFPKSTYSFECSNNNVSNILENFIVTDSKGYAKSLIVKYYYNGQTYNM